MSRWRPLSRGSGSHSDTESRTCPEYPDEGHAPLTEDRVLASGRWIGVQRTLGGTETGSPACRLRPGDEFAVENSAHRKSTEEPDPLCHVPASAAANTEAVLG